ncbi:hypoxia up-regulated protein 1-like isoform X2 [Ptychodera flava]|uniref:hypoxia up-regulated protein 1-like isoform X2 n=1 Tax=Ptychodera flava TaxID=63121 RepID=UPI00396A0077
MAGVKVCCLVLVAMMSLYNTCEAHFAVMSLDLGSEWYKVALVKPGVPMEIVLNKESKRKTPVAVSMRDNERIFGEDAAATGVRYPKSTYIYLQDMLAKSLNNPLIKMYQKRFPYYDLKEDPERGTVVFQHDEETQYSPEEILAMIMNRSREDAQDFADQPIKDAVITVPVYFNQAERRAVIRAAELVGINVLQLMNDVSAVALNYGVFRRNSFNATPTNIMFYDMGATSTTATIVSYQLVKTKEKSVTETNPQLTVKGVGFDRTLGGLEIEMRLQDHFAKLFTEQKKTKNNVRDSPRAMAKLLKEAKRVKKVLSANTDHMAQIEGLLDDVDFRAKITRMELEEMCEDIFSRVAKPVRMALEMSEMTLMEIDQVILVGGGTRVPKVQQLLTEAVKKSELGKSINADEAAALGASYQAAYLSKGFKVKKFIVKEANIYPIQVEFERVGTTEGSEFQKTVKRTLFGRSNPFPQKKVMTFNKHTDDFKFNVNYGDLGFLKDDDLRIFGKRNLTEVSLTGVADALSKNEDTESKGVKAHFKMDESGLLHLDKVESVFEKMTSENETQDQDEQSTLAKLGSTISNFFSSSKDDKESETSEEKENPDEETSNQDETDNTDGKIDGQDDTGDDAEKTGDDETRREAGEQEEKPSDGEKTEEGKSDGEKIEEKQSDGEKEEPKDEERDNERSDEENKDKESANKDDKSDTKEQEEKENATEKTDGKIIEKKSAKPVTIKEDLGVVVTILDLEDPSKEIIKSSKAKLKELKRRDLEKAEREKAQNVLESFIFETQDKLYQEEYEKATREEERSVLLGKLSEASDWLYDDGADADVQGYKDKYKTLKKDFKDVFFRVREHRERPEMLARLKEAVNASLTLMVLANNLTGDDQIYTSVELETLQKVTNDTLQWQADKTTEQAATPLHEKPVLLCEDIAEKITALDREIRYLLNKAKRERPKKEKTKKEKSKKKAENETKSENGEDAKTETADEQAIDENPVEEEVSETPETQEEIPQNLDNTETAQDSDSGKSDEEILQIGSPDSQEEVIEENVEEKQDEETKDKTHDPNEL